MCSKVRCLFQNSDGVAHTIFWMRNVHSASAVRLSVIYATLPLSTCVWTSYSVNYRTDSWLVSWCVCVCSSFVSLMPRPLSASSSTVVIINYLLYTPASSCICCGLVFWSLISVNIQALELYQHTLIQTHTNMIIILEFRTTMCYPYVSIFF